MRRKKKKTKPLPEWAVGLIQHRLWEIERLQLYDPFRVSHTIEIRSRDGEPKKTTGNRVGEEDGGRKTKHTHYFIHGDESMMCYCGAEQTKLWRTNGEPTEAARYGVGEEGSRESSSGGVTGGELS